MEYVPTTAPSPDIPLDAMMAEWRRYYPALRQWHLASARLKGVVADLNPSPFPSPRGRGDLYAIGIRLTRTSRRHAHHLRPLQDLPQRRPRARRRRPTIGAGLFGLLGPNGAGKSTLMRTIATLQEPDAGTIVLDGLDVLRRPAGACAAGSATCRRTSASIRASRRCDLLDHLAVLKGIADQRARREQVDALLQLTNLYDVRKQGGEHVLRRHEAALRHRPGAARRPAADHRRRADRGARSRGAQPLPQPAQRDRRERRGHPLHAHRRGRERSLPAHGHPRRRARAAARASRRELDRASSTGRVWRKTVREGRGRALPRVAHRHLHAALRRADAASTCSPTSAPEAGSSRWRRTSRTSTSPSLAPTRPEAPC